MTLNSKPDKGCFECAYLLFLPYLNRSTALTSGQRSNPLRAKIPKIHLMWIMEVLAGLYVDFGPFLPKP